MNQNAQYWQAKYNALAANIDDPKLIETAEKFAEACHRLAVASPFPDVFESTMHGMLQHIAASRPQEPPGTVARLLELEAQAAALIEVLVTWLTLHEEGLRSREDAVKVWNSGAIPRAYEQAKRVVASTTAGTSLLERLRKADEETANLRRVIAGRDEMIVQLGRRVLDLEAALSTTPQEKP